MLPQIIDFLIPSDFNPTSQKQTFTKENNVLWEGRHIYTDLNLKTARISLIASALLMAVGIVLIGSIGTATAITWGISLLTVSLIGLFTSILYPSFKESVINSDLHALILKALKKDHISKLPTLESSKTDQGLRINFIDPSKEIIGNASIIAYNVKLEDAKKEPVILIAALEKQKHQLYVLTRENDLKYMEITVDIANGQTISFNKTPLVADCCYGRLSGPDAMVLFRKLKIYAA